jgi:hypothetical protein
VEVLWGYGCRGGLRVYGCSGVNALPFQKIGSKVGGEQDGDCTCPRRILWYFNLS